jgi:hypothetical protein
MECLEAGLPRTGRRPHQSRLPSRVFRLSRLTLNLVCHLSQYMKPCPMDILVSVQFDACLFSPHALITYCTRTPSSKLGRLKTCPSMTLMSPRRSRDDKHIHPHVGSARSSLLANVHQWTAQHNRPCITTKTSPTPTLLPQRGPHSSASPTPPGSLGHDKVVI